MITFVDADRQWFKAGTGFDTRETSRELSFCAHAILQTNCFIVLDALEDDRFRDHPLVAGESSLRFYAGCPICDLERHRIGAFAVMHNEPRDFSRIDEAKLVELARITEEQLALDYPVRKKS